MKHLIILSTLTHSKEGGLYLFIIGMIVFVVSYYSFKYISNKKKRCTKRTMAQICSYTIKIIPTLSRDYGGSTPTKHYPRTKKTYYPVLNFKIDEERYTVEYDLGKEYRPFVIGEQVEIYYNLNDKNEIYIAAQGYHNQMKAISVIFFLLGIGVAACGVYVLFF